MCFTGAMVLAAVQAVALLQQEEEPLRALLDQLRSDDISIRDVAERRLLGLGQAALQGLRRAVEQEADVEVKSRIATVVWKLERPNRYGRAEGTWILRLESEVRTAKVIIGALDGIQIQGDGSGWMEREWVGSDPGRLRVLSLTQHQLKEAIDLIMDADILERDVSSFEFRKERVEPEEIPVWKLAFENGKHKRAMRLRLTPQLPEQFLRLTKFLQASDRFASRNVEDVILELHGDRGKECRRALLSIGDRLRTPLERALEAETDPDKRERLRGLVLDLAEKKSQ